MQSAIVAQAPGRVNLIGEHTDYNDGYVLPIAIDYRTNVEAKPRTDRQLTVESQQFAGRRVFALDRMPSTAAGDWSDYVRGMALELARDGTTLCGADLSISSTVPVGAGLGSSAALEVATAFALLALCAQSIDGAAVARAAQRAENAHAGTRSGIMDQFVSANAQARRAMLLDTRSLEFEQIAMPAGIGIVICNTMVRHSNASSRYNDRRAECEQSVVILQEQFPAVVALRDATMQQLADSRERLGSRLYRRARHVLLENARVLMSAAALRKGDVAALGRFMHASHESLRDDYEVSCPELDTMVDLARGFEGTFGARMTGGGFGGCTVNIVDAARSGAFIKYMKSAYARETGTDPELYPTNAAAGAAV